MKSTLRRHLGAAESTIEELRMEATSSQRHARKLSVDVQQLNHKLETEIRHGKEKEMELSALRSERDGLKQEVEQLRSEKQSSQDRENGEDDARCGFSFLLVYVTIISGLLLIIVTCDTSKV